MRLTYRKIEYIREVAQQGSVAAACKTLGVSQSSVFAAITAAEQQAGARLFSRSKGHGVVPTPAGRKLIVSARKFLAAGEDFERSMAQFSETSTPVLQIGCFAPLGAIMIPPVLKRFISQYGECEIVLKEGDQLELRNWLNWGTVDLVVTYDIGEEYGIGVTPICKCPAHALLHRDDPDAENLSISMQQLARKTHILLDLPETRAYILALFDFSGERPKTGLKTRSYETIRSAVANGLGASILNMLPCETSPDTDKVVRIPISNPLRQPTLVVADPYGDTKPEYVRAFINTVYEYIVGLEPENFAVVLPEFSKDLIYAAPDGFSASL